MAKVWIEGGIFWLRVLRHEAAHLFGLNWCRPAPVSVCIRLGGFTFYCLGCGEMTTFLSGGDGLDREPHRDRIRTTSVGTLF